MKAYIHKLKIKDVKHLAKLLHTTPKELNEICDNISATPQKYYIQWTKKTKTGKERPMVKIHGRLREILDKLKKILERIKVPAYVHGGIKGKSTITNARPHMGKPMLLRSDLEKHFPSVSHQKVCEMFHDQQECTWKVSNILTRLTTLDNGLPQGSPTSTLISNLVTLTLSNRLYGFAETRKVDCTQYVDDYTFSGSHRLEKYKDKIVSIISQEGFKYNSSKTITIPSKKEQITAGIRVNGKCPDIPSTKLKEIQSELSTLQQQIEMGSYLSEKTVERMKAKIRYVRRLNPGAAKPLNCKLRNIKSSNN